MQLFLFTTDPEFALRAQAAGIDSVIVDWETRGKQSRQCGRDLEINHDTPEDVERLARHLAIPVTVRLNAVGPETPSEIQCALDHGARILMLPMARRVQEVERVLHLLSARAKTIIQIETQSLVEQVQDLKPLPWDYAYIGLNDLMVSRGASSLWDAVLDGTVESIFETLRDRAVGFAGVTAIGGGYPIRFTLLLHEMTRLGCQLSFLRRTFKKELLDRDVTAEIRAVRVFWEASRRRGPAAVAADHTKFFSELLRIRETHDHPGDVQHAPAESITLLAA